ncbi:bromodomain-containing protein [Apis mellifera caucasica]|nr:bromodomain-containing protein [Apis mellifera caucasica]
MNNSLDQDFEEFRFSNQNKICKDDAVDDLQKFDKHIDDQNSIFSLRFSLFSCEICKKQFVTKKQLRIHIHTHLGRPRIVLRRVTNLKSFKKKHSNTYWLDPEKKGSLKLTLKKQNFTDSLKLKLKKSSESEDFTVVKSNINLGIENHSQRDVAGAKENDQRHEKNTENSINQPFENVMVEQQDEYGNIKFNTEEHNPLEENDRPPIDVNEGDSGVGSDMANPSEKEDQNVDDLQSSDQYDNSDKRFSETEDHEESDALEATCRETIENLKKLGEQSGSRSMNQLIENSGIEEDDDRGHESNMIHNLEENPAISIISKSTTFSNHTTDCTTVCEDEDKPEESTETTASFNWSQLSTNISNKNNESSKENEEQSDHGGDNNIDNAGSLLQNLIEHQRHNQNETLNNLPPETEYVSLEKLAETVNTCRVCNEKFKDIAHLDEHRNKAGHYQCNIPECINLIFNSPLEVSMHKAQMHGTPLSPSVSQLSPHLNTSSPHLNQNSPHLSQTSPQLNTHSPHAVSMESPNTPNSQQINRNSPLTSPHQTNSPTYNTVASTGQQIIPPVNFEQLPAPVQQLAQQVQRMPLPQTQMPPSLPPGANTMIPGPNYFVQPPGRPPLYRVPGPQGMHYPPHIAHLYPQYGPGPYPQMTAPPQMHSQLPQQISRGRYPTVAQSNRAPRVPQTGSTPRQRMKRPMQQSMQVQQNNSAIKQRRMDVLLPDRNEDADCHVIAQQKRNDGLPVIQNVQGATTQQTSRNDSTIHLTDSITLSVRQPGSAPAQVQNTSGASGKKSDAKAVANVLAARGITVTPAANKNKSSEQNKQQIPPQQQRTTSSQQPLNVTALTLNSAISIIPASSQKKQQEQGQFAVPHNKQNKTAVNEVERPPRPPTVDLTQDGPPQIPVVRRGRPPRALLTCQVCDKNFQNQEMLTQHMATHRAPSKLLHKCNLCPAQYPTVQALTTHKQAYHKEVDTVAQNGGAELALPVVDLKSPHVLNRLSNLGIQSYIPLSQLSAQTGGYFGLPIITIDGARNPNICNLGALGATSILSLGPLKHLSNR